MYTYICVYMYVYVYVYMYAYLCIHCVFYAQPSQQKCEVLPTALFDWFNQNMF